MGSLHESLEQECKVTLAPPPPQNQLLTKEEGL